MESSGSPETLEEPVVSYLDTFKCGICLLEVNDLEIFLLHKQTCLIERYVFCFYKIAMLAFFRENIEVFIFFKKSILKLIS